MTWLSILIIIKIGITTLLVAVPFMLFPKHKLEKSTGITAETPLLFRLYGVAIVALLVGYAFGVPVAEDGRFPWGVVWMGIVSNGGAAIYLLAHSQGNKQNTIPAVFFSLITLGLLAAAIIPEGALQNIW